VTPKKPVYHDFVQTKALELLLAHVRAMATAAASPPAPSAPTAGGAVHTTAPATLKPHMKSIGRAE
jgi:hypothetical protein